MPGAAQRIGIDLFEAYVNTKRAKNTTPFKAPRPWTKPAQGPSKTTTEDQEQRDRLDRLLYGGGPLTN